MYYLLVSCKVPWEYVTLCMTSKSGPIEVLACHLLGQPAPGLKSLPCLKTSSLRFIGLSCGKQSELGLGNRPTPVFLLRKSHAQGSLAGYMGSQIVRND